MSWVTKMAMSDSSIRLNHVTGEVLNFMWHYYQTAAGFVDWKTGNTRWWYLPFPKQQAATHLLQCWYSDRRPPGHKTRRGGVRSKPGLSSPHSAGFSYSALVLCQRKFGPRWRGSIGIKECLLLHKHWKMVIISIGLLSFLAIPSHYCYFASMRQIPV